jgi:23S rRNA (uracil1939-C5)-methyltransferase
MYEAGITRPLFFMRLVMGNLKKGEHVELRVEKLIYGGAGLARIDGQVVFIDFAAPGDFLNVEIIEVKKNFARGRIDHIITGGDARTAPRCVIFGSCGGCQWQHVKYQHQIEAKKEILKDTVRKFLVGETLSLGEFVESPSQFNYRNRIQVTAKNGKLGFYGKGTHEIVPTVQCDIAEKALNNSLEELGRTKPVDGKFRIQIGLEGATSTTRLNDQEDPIGFSQVNAKQNDRLQAEILTIYSQFPETPVYDLYGGYGNFSIPLSLKFTQSKVECVEWSRQAVEQGINLARLKGLTKLKFINTDVESYLQRTKLEPDAFVIIDPPRDGCSRTSLIELAAKAPIGLVYISCDPMTWGRDSQIFLKEARQRGSNYRIATIHGLDMFPQTDHIEVFSFFERMD